MALLLFKSELSMIALIGIMLLIGIVKKKNAIMMIEFRIRERTEGKRKTPRSDLRSLPAAVQADHDDHGGSPARCIALAVGMGVGSELRRRSASPSWAVCW